MYIHRYYIFKAMQLKRLYVFRSKLSGKHIEKKMGVWSAENATNAYLKTMKMVSIYIIFDLNYVCSSVVFSSE